MNVPRYLIPLIIGVLGFAVSRAATESPRPESTRQFAQAADYVYCANGKIAVDRRDPERMRSARGGGFCLLARIDRLSDAERFFMHEKLGGPGAACGCE